MQFLVYFQMNYGLLLYLKLARVDVGNVSKKSESMEGIIAWSIFASWILTELCLYMIWKTVLGYGDVSVIRCDNYSDPRANHIFKQAQFRYYCDETVQVVR